MSRDSNLESNNMQKYQNFIELIYKTSLGNFEKNWNGECLTNYYYENEGDLVQVFAKVNEDCLNDLGVIKENDNREFYFKKIGTKVDNVLFYPPHHIGSVNHDITMDLLYIPSLFNDIPNKIRIDVKEQIDGKQEYRYINFSVDICDDGTIAHNNSMIVDEQRIGNESQIIKIPCDMSKAHISFNDEGINIIRDIFVDMFQKSGIKGNTYVIRR